MSEVGEISRERVTVVLVLILAGLILVLTAIYLHHWMMWATGALVIRFAVWLGED